MRIKADGSMNGVPEILTDGAINAGFPSYSADGRKLVYRVWSPTERGLRIMDLTTRSVTVLSTEGDNTPGWSPDGSKIVFVRKQVDANDPNKFNYDSTAEYGYKDEVSLYDNTFPPDGQNWVMKADGSDKPPSPTRTGKTRCRCTSRGLDNGAALVSLHLGV